MRVLVFGAGAIGSLLGHRLSHVGHDVTMVGRAVYASAVATHGLTVESPEGRQISHPRAISSLDALADSQPWDLVILTVKVFDTQDAVQQLVPFLSSGVPLLLVQNGVGGEEIARQVAPDAEIISGSITLVVSVLGPGHVRMDKKSGGLSLAPTRAGQDIGKWIELLRIAGFQVVSCRDYRAQRWSKLLLNMLGNAVPAILDLSPGDVYRNPRLFAVELDAFREALAVMDAMRIAPVRLPGYPVPLLAWIVRRLPRVLLRPILVRMVGSGRGAKKPSLQIDLQRGRAESEVSYLNGAIVTAGRQLGVPVPVNTAIVDTLLGIAGGQLSWDELRGRPERLLALVGNMDRSG